MFKYISFLMVFIFISCDSKNISTKKFQEPDLEIRKAITGFNFNNSDIISIDIKTKNVNQLNLKKDSVHLEGIDKNFILNKLDALQEKGIHKCIQTHLIYLNLKDDTMSFSLCNTLVRAKGSDQYYELPNGKSILYK